MYTKESALVVTKAVQGLRELLEEIYTNPVRVVSIGKPVEKREVDPENPAGNSTSIEFCSGTQVLEFGGWSSKRLMPYLFIQTHQVVSTY